MPGPERGLCNSGQVAHARTHRIVAYVTQQSYRLIYSHWGPPAH